MIWVLIILFFFFKETVLYYYPGLHFLYIISGSLFSVKYMAWHGMDSCCVFREILLMHYTAPKIKQY
jgi:hypothetical protein